MLHKEAKSTLRFLLDNYSKYDGMLFFSDNFKGYRYSNMMMDKFDRICGDDEKLFFDTIKLYERYYKLRTYLKEVAPKWSTVEVIPYADNSVEEKQVDKFGNVRYIMITPPSGDLCY